jgi:pyruvate-formate lyase
MQSPPMLCDDEALIDLVLQPDSRSARLREMYWSQAYLQALIPTLITGCGENTLTGHAKDFAALLDASSPRIQPHELVVGCCLVVPEDKERIDLGYYDRHYPPGHATLLRLGLAGIRDRARARLQTETDPGKRDFLRAVEISYEAACKYVEKTALHADEMAAMEQNPARKLELERIAAVCHELATAVPSSFHAALQLFQFTRVFGGYGCIGRFDQWMYPFYENDIQTGRITQQEAQELLECLFVKLNEFSGVNYRGEAVEVHNDDLRNIVLAGQTPGGEDASNELTYMCLEASGKLMLPEPKLNVRCFGGSPRRLLQECCRVLAKGANVLAIFNDDVAIPALSRLGIPLADARDYCCDGCSELIIGGKCSSHFWVHDALPPLRELVLQAEQQPYATFGEVMADYKSRLTPYMAEGHGADHPITFPFFAASVEDCLEKASPAGIRYSLWGSILAEAGNAADGLAAIKKLIYQDGQLTWSELASALRAEYAGYEPLRQRLINRMPKYGNDNDEVDHIAREIAEFFCDGVHERAGNPVGHGSKRAAGLMCFAIHRKRELPASPDGRRQGDPCATSFSPAVGMDRSGPTAALNSVAKVDLTKASHGSVLDLALHSSVIGGPDAIDKFVALVDAFLAMGCTATLQINVIDRETLLRAQKQPDLPEFRTLIVRVWGFSAVFVDLPRALQDHVLSRTQHGL